MKNGKAYPRKDEKEPKHPRDPLQRVKLGLAAPFCQKNEIEIAIGLFIAEERHRKQAQAQQTTARRHTCSARRFPSSRATTRRQGSIAQRFASNRKSTWLHRLVPTPRTGPPDSVICRRAVPRLFISSFFSSLFLSLRPSSSTPFFTFSKILQNNAKQA